MQGTAGGPPPNQPTVGGQGGAASSPLIGGPGAGNASGLGSTLNGLGDPMSMFANDFTMDSFGDGGFDSGPLDFDNFGPWFANDDSMAIGDGMK